MNKYNIIYIFADQLAYNRVNYNNDSYAYTPSINKFSKESMILDNCISGHPVCAPYRASLFTGKYTTSTGMVINEIRISPKHETIAKVLNKNGYITSYLGKWHLYGNKFNDPQSIESNFIPPGEHRLGFQEFVGYNFHHVYYAPKANYFKDKPEKIFCKKYEPDEQVDMAISTLTRLSKSKKPFAFFLSLGTPHDPWTKNNVPSKYFDMFKDKDIPLPKNYSNHNDKHTDMWAKFHFPHKERYHLKDWLKVYYAMVANLDDNFNRLITSIKQLGLDKNSIIVFTSDHGECFGSHGRRAKNIFYDEACRVPFLIKMGNQLKYVKNDLCINTVDLMPTLLGLLKIKSPKGVEGEDKSKYLLNTSIKEDNNKGCLLMGTGKTAIWGDGCEWRAYRNKQYTYAIYLKDKEELLFDNLKDPYQMNNLIKDPKYQEIKDKLKTLMFKKMNQIGDDFEKTSFYKKYWVKERIIKDTLPRRKDLFKR